MVLTKNAQFQQCKKVLKQVLSQYFGTKIVCKVEMLEKNFVVTFFRKFEKLILYGSERVNFFQSKKS